MSILHFYFNLIYPCVKSPVTIGEYFKEFSLIINNTSTKYPLYNIKYVLDNIMDIIIYR